MVSTRPIRLDLPADLYARIAAAAARTERPVEAILVDTLALLLDAPMVDWRHLASTLDTLSDAELWALIHRRLAWTASVRLHDLTLQGKQMPLSEDEQSELEDLIDEADRLSVLRSHALRILQDRGHDIRNYLPLGA